MNKQLLKIAGLAALVLSLHSQGFSQNAGSSESEDNDTTPVRSRSWDEITIRHKGDKDARVTVEIKNGEIFINGKPASEYKDDNLTITKRKFKTVGDDDVLFSDGDGAMTITPFRNNGGGWNYDRRITPRKGVSGAFLGVTSLKPENGPDGAKVGEVSEGSAAEKAGLKEGDLITRVDDKTIDGPESLSKTIRGYKPGDKVTITFKRDNKEQKVTAELGKSRTDNIELYSFDGRGMNFDAPEFRMPKMYMPRNFNFSYGDKQLRL